MAAIEIRCIDHVVLRVRDVAASKRFYCDALGCTVERESEALGLHQLRAGASLIDLVPVAGALGKLGGAGPAAAGRNVDHFALAMAAFDAAAIAVHLHAFGIAPGDIGDRYGAGGMGPSIYIRDPDGNVVELKGPARP
jgi:catechol 2,3-dioxygenase-like lactoylglutathione lyase family enzyme